MPRQCPREKGDRFLHLAQALFPQPAVVERVPVQEVIAQGPRRPDAEQGAPLGVDAVSDRQDGIQVEVLNLVGLAVGGSVCKLCTYCTPFQLPFLEHVAEVLRDDRSFTSEQLRHLLLAQPNRVQLQPHIDPHLAVGCLVDDDLTAQRLVHGFLGVSPAHILLRPSSHTEDSTALGHARERR